VVFFVDDSHEFGFAFEHQRLFLAKFAWMFVGFWIKLILMYGIFFGGFITNK